MVNLLALEEVQKQAKLYIELVCRDEMRKVLRPEKAYVYDKTQLVLVTDIKCEADEVHQPWSKANYLSAWPKITITFLNLETASIEQTLFRSTYPVLVFVNGRRNNTDGPLEFKLTDNPYYDDLELAPETTQIKNLQRKAGKIFRCSKKLQCSQKA